jgi:hypothetical protein
MPDFGAVDTLIVKLDAAGLEAQTQSARAVDAGGVESRITVKPREMVDAR